MIVSIKDSVKLFAVSVMSCCAVFVCTMFLNYLLDISEIREDIVFEQVLAFYEAQVSTAKVVSAVSGGCLLITTAVMLIFYVKHYINVHKKELGILKALGYPRGKIAAGFLVFGACVLVGTAAGFGGAFIIMPAFYDVQNEDKLLPEFGVGFHPELLLFLVILPAVFFALLASVYAFFRLKTPVLTLIRDAAAPAKAKVRQKKDDGLTFIAGLRKTTVKSRKSLAFFIIFASFCYSSMTQMSFSMNELASPMMGVMILVIGLLLAFVTLFLAAATVVDGNRRTVAVMRAFGYSFGECRGAILGGYRPLSYIGFAIGSVYQYVLLRVMVDVVFKDIEGVPEYEFDFPAMLVSLASFVVVYEAFMYFYSSRIRKISVKEIMLE